MAFKKQGSPQPFKIASGLCESCGAKPGTSLVDGKMICEDCKKEKETKNG